jgi:hypothetical protein
MSVGAYRSYRNQAGRLARLDSMASKVIVRPTRGASPFSGRAFVIGNWTIGLGTKAWVRCNLDTGTAVDHDGPAPNPFPPNEEWFDVSATFGDIHIIRA